MNASKINWNALSSDRIGTIADNAMHLQKFPFYPHWGGKEGSCKGKSS